MCESDRGPSEARGSKEGKAQTESMASGWGHGFQKFDLHDLNEVDRHNSIVNTFRVPRSS